MLPVIEPIPPSTTITYDFTAGKAPTSGDALMIGARSAPASAARAPAAPNTVMLTRAGSIPASDAPSRFCATAWMRLPHAVERTANASATMTATPMTVASAFCPESMIGPARNRETSTSAGPSTGYGPTTLSTRFTRRIENANVTTTAYSSFKKPQLEYPE